MSDYMAFAQMKNDSLSIRRRDTLRRNTIAYNEFI